VALGFDFNLPWWHQFYFLVCLSLALILANKVTGQVFSLTVCLIGLLGLVLRYRGHIAKCGRLCNVAQNTGEVGLCT